MKIQSAAGVTIEAPSVKLGSAPAANVATVGDLAIFPGGSLQKTMEAAFAILNPSAPAVAAALATFTAPGTPPLVGMIVTGVDSVSA